MKNRRKQAAELANQKGFHETKDYSFDSCGEKVYKKGRTRISLDKTSHKGGFWKVYSGDVRTGTFDKTLKIRIGN